jgi:hypothetical protein
MARLSDSARVERESRYAPREVVMRKHRSFYGLLALGAISGLVAIACTAGVGAPAAFDDPYDRPPDSREKPPSSRDNPPITGRETPPSSLENPGSQGGGPAAAGATAGACPPCDQKLDCQIATGTKTQKGSLTLATVDGKCVAGDKKDGVTIECGGQILQNGSPIGSWSIVNGGVTATTTVNGQTSTVTCSPKAATPTPTGTATTTPTPKPTPTVIVDAGTKG